MLESDLVAEAVGEALPAASGRVRAHVETCAPCRDELGRYRAIDGVVGRLATAPLDDRGLDRAREALRARLGDLRSRLVSYRVFPSPFGHLLIARSEVGVLLVEYLGRGRTLTGSQLRRRRDLEVIEDGREVEALERELLDYLAGRRRELSWPLDLRLARSSFHRRVLDATLAIPYGAVMSYAGLAREIGRPDAVRAAAQALRWNPLPIVIPCHRVVGSSGSLTGYAGGGTDRKETLLTAEGVPIVHRAREARIRRDAMYVRAPGEPEYCLPSCASVDPFAAGGVLFASREQARAAGLDPCTTCRPDLHPLGA
jgi:O-6-methylguanine DNA methyltransferase